MSKKQVQQASDFALSGDAAKTERERLKAATEKAGITHKGVWLLQKFYVERIRPHGQRDMVGVLRQIQRLIAAGVTPLQLKTALENYEQHACDPRYRYHIRKFFTKEIILMWQTPLEGREKPAEVTALESVQRASDAMPLFLGRHVTTPAPAGVLAADDTDDSLDGF